MLRRALHDLVAVAQRQGIGDHEHRVDSLRAHGGETIVQ